MQYQIDTNQVSVDFVIYGKSGNVVDVEFDMDDLTPYQRSRIMSFVDIMITEQYKIIRC